MVLTEKQAGIQDRISEIRKMRLGDIADNSHNWRLHPEYQRKALGEIYKQVGWAGVPLVYFSEREGKLTFVDGHLRKEETPDLVVRVAVMDLDDAEADILLSAYDPLGRLAEVNVDALAELEKSAKVKLEDFWPVGELETLLKGLNGDDEVEEAEPQIDKAEELQEKWECETGQVWQIESVALPGRHHRLICGDCREQGDLDALLNGVKVNGVFTSPPYAMQRAKQYGGVPVDEYTDWWEAVQENVQGVLTEDGSFFVNIKPHCEDGQRVLYVMDLVQAMVRRWGWRFVDELCWQRNTPPGKYNRRFKNGFEPVYHFSFNGLIKFNPWSVAGKSDEAILQSVGGGFNAVYDPVNYTHKNTILGRGQVLPNNIVLANQGEVNIGTLNQVATFPIKLPTFFIKVYSDPGDIWLDPFCGSGTVIVAAENEGRLGMGVEKLPKYCAVILERLEQHIGQKAELIEG